MSTVAGVEPSAKLEQVVRLQAVLLAHERHDPIGVCEEGEGYLALPDAHLDLVTERPNVHAVVARAYDDLGWPDAAVEHYRRALLGLTHIHLIDPTDLPVRAVAARLVAGRYEGIDGLLDEVVGAELPPALRSTALRLRAVATWRTTGDLSMAESALTAASRAAAADDLTSRWQVAVSRAQVLIEAGRADEAAAAIGPVVGRGGLDAVDPLPAAPPEDRATAAHARAVAAHAELRRGDAPAAAELLDAADELADADHAPAWTHHLLVRAELLGVTGEDAAAHQHWRCALDLAEERGLRPTEVHLWEVRARTATAPDERADALARARATAEALAHRADLARLAWLDGC